MELERQVAQDLKVRTRNFAPRVVRLYDVLPKNGSAQVIGKQILRSGTGVGANYREALPARSKLEYAAKMNISLMELEETLYWLELLEAAQIVLRPKLAALDLEVGELTAIFVTLIKQARAAVRKTEPRQGAGAGSDF
jgi:four helix bundle protein